MVSLTESLPIHHSKAQLYARELKAYLCYSQLTSKAGEHLTAGGKTDHAPIMGAIEDG